MALEQGAAFGVAFDSGGAVIQVPPCGQSLGLGSGSGLGFRVRVRVYLGVQSLDNVRI